MKSKSISKAVQEAVLRIKNMHEQSDRLDSLLSELKAQSFDARGLRVLAALLRRDGPSAICPNLLFDEKEAFELMVTSMALGMFVQEDGDFSSIDRYVTEGRIRALTEDAEDALHADYGIVPNWEEA